MTLVIIEHIWKGNIFFLHVNSKRKTLALDGEYNSCKLSLFIIITRNTILSQKDLELLEAVVLRYGKIVSSEQIQAAIGQNVSRGAARTRVAGMSKAGWLIRLKKGLYLVVTDISGLGFTDVSDLVIAQSLNLDSYISFESALQFHNTFDQMLARIDAVTIGKTRTYQVLKTKYAFSSVKRGLYFGFAKESINNQKVNVADIEKAILDLLYFRSSGYTVSLVIEKLREYQDQFDFKKLKAYSIRYSLGMVRKIGFLLDQIDVDTTDLFSQNQVKKNSFSKLTQDVEQFNAKWRLYYDPDLVGLANPADFKPENTQVFTDRT